MSNVILKLLSDLENYNGEFTSSSKGELTTIIDIIHHFNRKYQVIQSPTKYDDDTIFKDSKNRAFFIQE